MYHENGLTPTFNGNRNTMTEMNPPFLGSTLRFSNCFTPLSPPPPPLSWDFWQGQSPPTFFKKRGDSNYVNTCSKLKTNLCYTVDKRFIHCQL